MTPAQLARLSPGDDVEVVRVLPADPAEVWVPDWRRAVVVAVVGDEVLCRRGLSPHMTKIVGDPTFTVLSEWVRKCQ